MPSHTLTSQPKDGVNLSLGELHMGWTQSSHLSENAKESKAVLGPSQVRMGPTLEDNTQPISTKKLWSHLMSNDRTPMSVPTNLQARLAPRIGLQKKHEEPSRRSNILSCATLEVRPHL